MQKFTPSDSSEEMYFVWYLEELKKHGFIKNFKYQPKPFLLSEEVKAKRIVQLKTKTSYKEYTFLRPHSYQADYLIQWDNKGYGIFFHYLDDILSGNTDKRHDDIFFLAQARNYGAFSVVDVKGEYSQNDAFRRFSIEQKLVFQKFGIYVQKVIPATKVNKDGKVVTPSALFNRTFTPERYLFTDQGKKVRKITYEVKTLNQFLKL